MNINQCLLYPLHGRKNGAVSARDPLAAPLLWESLGYRGFGVTSSLVVEAAGLDELPGPGCALDFMRFE